MAKYDKNPQQEALEALTRAHDALTSVIALAPSVEEVTMLINQETLREIDKNISIAAIYFGVAKR